MAAITLPLLRTSRSMLLDLLNGMSTTATYTCVNTLPCLKLQVIITNIQTTSVVSLGHTSIVAKHRD